MTTRINSIKTLDERGFGRARGLKRFDTISSRICADERGFGRARGLKQAALPALAGAVKTSAASVALED